MTYLHQHAGYTRVHNPLTGDKDLQRLPGLVAIAYQHETSRCGDPHLHTHVIVPNRQARADGHIGVAGLEVAAPRGQGRRHHLPGHAAPRAARRARLRVGSRSTSSPGWPRSPASTKDCIKAWSQRSTRLREWARDNLVVVDGEPTPRRPPPRKKPRARPNPNRWRGPSSKSSGAPMRAVWCSTAPRITARAASGGAQRGAQLDRARLARWPRASTRRRSPARTWSSWSARSCPSMRPAIRAR